jgi:hypothetical protein
MRTYIALLLSLLSLSCHAIEITTGGPFNGEWMQIAEGTIPDGRTMSVYYKPFSPFKDVEDHTMTAWIYWHVPASGSLQENGSFDYTIIDCRTYKAATLTALVWRGTQLAPVDVLAGGWPKWLDSKQGPYRDALVMLCKLPH